MSAMPTLSEAAALAMHAMALLATRPGRCLQAKEMASALDASQAHLSKVLQRLTRSGLLHSTRGPRGGFVLADGARDARLLDVYESIDGPLPRHTCLFDAPVCRGDGCVMGDLTQTINQQIRDYLSGTRVSQLSEIGWKHAPDPDDG